MWRPPSRASRSESHPDPFAGQRAKPRPPQSRVAGTEEGAVPDSAGASRSGREPAPSGQGAVPGENHGGIPAGAHERVRLDVPHTPFNFNREVSGDTVCILTYPRAAFRK